MGQVNLYFFTVCMYNICMLLLMLHVHIIYRLRKDWFDWNKYESKRAVLNSEVEATMEAIKDCKFILASKPSKRDLGLLREYYGIYNYNYCSRPFLLDLFNNIRQSIMVLLGGKDSTKRKVAGPPGQDLEGTSG